MTKTINKWTMQANKLLTGKRIAHVRYMNDKEMKEFMWTERGIVIFLEDGTAVVVSQDDEGNGPGALLTNNKEIPIIPVVS